MPVCFCALFCFFFGLTHALSVVDLTGLKPVGYLGISNITCNNVVYSNPKLTVNFENPGFLSGISYTINYRTYGASWFSELWISFGDLSATSPYSLQINPNVKGCDNGCSATTNSVYGVSVITPSDPIYIASGKLVIEIYDTYDDLSCPSPVEGLFNSGSKLDLQFSPDNPMIWAISPMGLSTAGGSDITITGRRFVSPLTVSVGGAGCGVKSYTAGQIICTLPAGQGRSVVSVTANALSHQVLPPLSRTFFTTSVSATSGNPNCYPLSVPTDPAWSTTYFCSDIGWAGLGVSWEYNGPLLDATYQCVKINAPTKTSGWNQVYFCIPRVMNYTLAWSTTGAISGQQCVNFRHPSDSTWGNNYYLCARNDEPNGGHSDTGYIYASPVIMSATPLTAPTSGNVLMTVRGSEFGPFKDGTIYVGPNVCTPTATYNQTTAVCTIPPGAGFNYVTISVGGQVSPVVTNVAVTYNAPSVDGINPTSAPTFPTPPAVFTVTGQSFGVSQGSVLLQGASVNRTCTVLTWNHQTITCNLPGGDGSGYAVIVIASNGIQRSTPNANAIFSYLPPAIFTNSSGISPALGDTQGNFILTIRGANFGQTGTVTVGGVLCPLNTWSDTQITCLMSPGEGANLPVKVTSNGQTNSSPFPTFSFYAPVVSSVLPLMAPSGANAQLTVSGNYFGLSANVYIKNSSNLCSPIFRSHQQILCTLPIGTGTNLDVWVLVGSQQSNIVEFSYAPVVSTIIPATGATSGNTLITIYGSNFNAVTTVTIGGSACTSPSVTLSPSGDQVTCRTPPGQGINLPVVLTVPLGIAISDVPFSYNAPVITGIDPTSGSTTGEVITISGNDFGSNPTIAIGNLGACSSPSSNGTAITCTAPAGTGAGISVVVTVGGQSSQSFSWSYVPPVITKLTPSNGPTNGGSTITISGTDFGTSTGLVTIILGGKFLTPSKLNGTSIEFTLPSGLGVVSISVMVNTQRSNSLNFTYDSPTIQTAAPLIGPTDAASVPLILTLTGQSFGDNGVVTVGGKVCTITGTGYTQNSIQCIVPNGVGLLNLIQVAYAGQTSSQLFYFNYTTPSVSSVNPTHGPTDGSNSQRMITISGTSFGTSGSVTIDGQTCTISTWSHRQIQCITPVWQGHSLPVVVTNSVGQTSTVDSLSRFSYDAPIITSVSPSSGPTNGTVVVVRGSNFGHTATVRIGSFGACTPTSTPPSSFQIECTTPPGQGANLAVVVTAGGQDSAAGPASTFSYLPPTILSVTPLEGPTEGQVTIAVTGTNFGIGSAYDLYWDGEPSMTSTVLSISNTTLSFVLPRGSGGNKLLKLVAGGQTSTYASSQLFSYSKPVVTSVTGCPTLTGSSTIDCSTQAPITLTISGSNFGDSTTSSSLLSIKVGLIACTSITFQQSDTELTCQLPVQPTGGFNLPVIVTLNSLSNLAGPYVSYAGPLITSSTLRLFGDPLPGGHVLLPEQSGTLVAFSGKFFYDNQAAVTIKYGLPGTDLPFSCDIDSLVSDSVTGVSDVTCRTSIGVGAGLVMRVQVGPLISVESVDTLSYPEPVVLPGTLRLGNINNPAFTTKTGTSLEGDLVFFECNNTGNNVSLISVWYGPQNASTESLTECKNVNLDLTHGLNPVISCMTQQGFGGPYYFTVHVSNQVARGTDSYYYLTSPTVTKVEGCSTNQGSATYNCPTSGGARLTIHGSNFTDDSTSIRIGNNICTNLVLDSGGEIAYCDLPAGAGYPASVVVTTGTKPPTFSPAAPLVYYSPAQITALSGCNNTGSSTIDCSRLGGTNLTITGTNFGPPPAIIFIGSELCTPVIHDTTSPQTKLYCQMPAGTFTNVAVTFLQNGGALGTTTDQIVVSYWQCPMGQYGLVRNTTCLDCPSGRYTGGVGLASCTQCDSGSYATGTGNSKCLPCVAGKYSGPGADSCTECSPGFYQSSQGEASCLPCGSGSSSNLPGARTCDLCPLGKSQPNPQSTSCVNCTAGWYAGSTGLSLCVACPTSTYTNKDGQSECVKCNAGYVAGGVGATTCDPCQPGNYTDSTGQAICKTCDSGFFSNSSASTSCTPCSAGSYSVKLPTVATGPIGCTPCNSGTFIDSPGQNTCYNCPVGTYNPDSGATGCLPCPQGTITNTEGQTVCAPCPSGTFTPSNGSTFCEACPIGKWSNTTSSTGCTSCDSGTVQPLSGKSGCASCPAGSYMNAVGQAVCIQCDSGYYTNTSGQSACTPCPQGRYSVKTTGVGPTSCSNCPAGYYAQSQASPLCTECSPGFYQNQTGSSECTRCPIGSYSSQLHQTACDLCETGKFAPTNGSFVCTLCPEGTYANVSGADACQACPIGFYQGSQGQINCLPCPTGTFSSSTGAAFCVTCPAGQSRDVDADSSRCNECPAGTYGSYNALNVPICVACSPGQFQAAPGQRQCDNCPAGRISTVEGATTCDVCSPGTFTDSGSSQCFNCTAGTYSASSGAKTCVEAPVGSYVPENGSSFYTPCPSGSAQPNEGASSCILCAAGSSNFAQGQASCDLCASGTYSSLPGAQRCALCEAGKYSEKALGSTTCLSCDSGKYINAPGQAACLFCLPGTYANTTGLSTCTNCPPGTSAEKVGASGCEPCGRGSFADSTSSVTCTPCLVGQHMPGFGATICLDCDPGSAQPSTGQSTCTACDTGSYQSFNGRTTCLLCSSGSFSNTTGLTICDNCERGFYQPQNGQTTCLPCEPGLYSEVGGLSYCLSCGVGSYSNVSGTTTCAKCEPGYYQPSRGQSTCLPCPNGTAVDLEGQSVCVACEPGKYGDQPALAFCKSCPVGKTQTQNGQGSCVDCEIGKFAGDQGTSICAMCGTGTYANATGQSACYSCAPGSYQANTGQSRCELCGFGQFNPSSLQSGCLECAAGTYGNGTGLTACVSCPGGTYQNEIGQLRCMDCVPGKFSGGGVSACGDCGAREAAPYPGMEACLTCDVNAVSVDGIKCECDVSYAGKIVAINSSDKVSDIVCTKCPAGAVCDRVGQMFGSLAAENGYWSLDGVFYRCLMSYHCKGGLNSTCGDNRMGPLCAECIEGYAETVGGKCTKCVNMAGSAVYFVFIFLLVAFLLWLQMYILLRSGQNLTTLAEKEEDMRMQGKKGFIVDIDPVHYRKTWRHVEVLSIDGTPAPKPNFTFKLKILLGFIQIITNLAIGLEVPWPSAFKSFVQWFNPANFDFVQISSLSCVVKISYYRKLWTICAVPPALILALFLLYLCPQYIKYRHPTDEHHFIKRKTARRNFWKLLLFTLFLIYPTVSSTILRLYVCKYIGGVPYLLADFSLHCYTSEWDTHASFAATMILVYPIGIPAFFFTMLWRYRHRLDESGIRCELGFLYDAYERELWFFEMLDMLHKLIVTSVVAFLPFSYQMPIAMLFVMLYSDVIFSTKPYISKGDDRLHLLCQVEILLLLMAGDVFQRNKPDMVMDIVMSVVLIGVVVFFIIFFIIQAGLALSKIWTRKKIKAFLQGRRETVSETSSPSVKSPKRVSTSLGGKPMDKEMEDYEGRTVERSQFGVQKSKFQFEDADVHTKMRNPLWLADVIVPQDKQSDEPETWLQRDATAAKLRLNRILTQDEGQTSSVTIPDSPSETSHTASSTTPLASERRSIVQRPPPRASGRDVIAQAHAQRQAAAAPEPPPLTQDILRSVPLTGREKDRDDASTSDDIYTL